MTLALLVGWIGAAIALTGYLLSVARRNPAIFHVANMIGSGGLAVSAASTGAWPNLALNFCFCTIALWGLTLGRSRLSHTPREES